MGTATAEQTRQQLELTRRSLEGNVDRLVARMRRELDWRARLRKDAVPLAVIGGGVAVVVTVSVLLRRRFRPRKDGLVVANFETMDLRDVAKELRALREELSKQRDGAGGPIMKLATAAAAAAAGAAGRTAAAKLIGDEEPARSSREKA